MKTKTALSERLRFFILLISTISGTTLTQAAQGDDWNYFVAGYLNATYIDATTTAGTPAGDQAIEIDASFSDLLDNLDYGFMGLFIARKDKLSINLDMVFIGLEIEESPQIGPPIGPPVGPADLKVAIDVDIREHELYVGYQAFAQYPALELIGGVRYIDQDIKVNLTTAGPTTPPKIVTGDSWLDPFIGLRYLGPINDKWNWILRGDVGGFGVGSDFAWRIDAGASYRFAQQWEAAIWYKILDLDYETGTSGSLDRYTWDGTESGITLGVGYYF